MFFRLALFLLVYAIVASCCKADYCTYDEYPMIYVNFEHKVQPTKSRNTYVIYDTLWNELSNGTYIERGAAFYASPEVSLKDKIYVLTYEDDFKDTISQVHYIVLTEEEVCNPRCWGSKTRETRTKFTDLQFKANGEVLTGNQVTFPLD